MEKEKVFNKNWKEFIKHNLTNMPPERMDTYDIARIFFELGFNAGVFFENGN